MNRITISLSVILTTAILIYSQTTGFSIFQEVNALPPDPLVSPDAPVKNVLLIANETVVQVAPDNPLHPGGITYAAMTFNNTIPAPVIAADRGDILNVTLKNAGKVIHSMDFHASMGPNNVLSGNIAPGESKTWTVPLPNAGVFVYHCGADALNGVWEHIANGMYGAVVVHPEKEKPAKEFYVVFSEIFNTADKGVFQGTNGTVGTFDIAKFLDNDPDLVLTNGMAHKYVPAVGEQAKLPLNPDAQVFQVKPGELTRWYIANPGPNGYVAFHFISGQMDVRDGTTPNGDDYGTQLINDETYTIPPGSASVFESVFPEEGTYVAVDHAMDRVVKGAAFAVVATPDASDTDHPIGTAVAPKGSPTVSAP